VPVSVFSLGDTLSSLEKLKAAATRQDVAELLGYKLSSLTYILYKLPPATKYTTFDIPKKSGGVRQISAPIERVKNLQRQLAKLLTNCRIEIEAKGPKRSS
jgi:RNA-directed DNA polymerase